MNSLIDLGNNVYTENDNTKLFEHRLFSIVVRASKIIHKFLVLPPNQKIVIKQLTGAYGEFHMASQIIYINPNHRSYPEIISTLCHEAVHSEQYFLQRTSLLERDNQAHIQFDGILYEFQLSELGNSDFPWEIEAYARQDMLAYQVIGELNKDKRYAQIKPEA